MSENVSDGWACNCPPGSDPEACFCMYANGTLMAEVTQADYDALLAERDALREALDAIVRLQAKWDAPVRSKDVEASNAAWAAVGSEAHKIATMALRAALAPERTTKEA